MTAGAATLEEAPRIDAHTWIALFSQLVMNTAAFMAMPFLAIYLRTTLDFGAGATGTILSIFLWSSRGLPSVTGALADKIGSRWSMTAGMTIRAVGFGGLAVFDGFAPLAVMAFLMGFGGALYDPAVNAVFAAQPPSLRPRVFTLHTGALNVGVIIGPAVGALVVTGSPDGPFIGSALLFLAMGIVLLVTAPEGARVETVPIAQNYKTLLRNTSFVRFWFIMLLWWVTFAQLTVSFPLEAADLTGDRGWASALFLVNGIVGIVALFGVNRLSHRYAPTTMLTWGFLLVGLGFAIVPAVGDIAWLIFCIAVYTLGESIMLPCSDMKVADYTTEQTSATYFGVFILTYAIGGSAGNYLGNWLIGRDDAVPWLVYGAIAGLGAVAMHVFRSWEQRTQPREAAA
ncbi:MAG TPA: MFS transporter [Actinomycetota bacterium]|nr:MFS transporter [Actinomycetota bacterium]